MPAPKGHSPYNVNGEGGRPRIYTLEIIDQIAADLEQWIKDKDNLFIQKFFFEKGINHKRIPEFKELSERFRAAYDQLDAKQQYSLFEGGLKKKYAYPMCALILSHNHGIIAKTEQKLTGTAADPLSFVMSNIDGNSKSLVNDKNTH